MSNINNPAGAQIKSAIVSANFNTLVNEYIIPTSDSSQYFRNDFVKTNATSEKGIPICVKAVAGDTLRGIIIGFKPEHEYEDTVYREPNTRRTAYVCDDPKIEFEIQVSELLQENDIGKNAEILVANGTPVIGLSGTQLDQSTLTTGGAQLKILRLVDDSINELGEYSKVMCIILEHELNGSAGAGTALHNDLINLAYDVAGHGNGKSGFQRGTTLSSSSPSITDDTTQGYVPGDLWLNTSSRLLYYCVDNTTGAAIWDAIEAGIHWQEAIINQVDFTTAEPAGPTINDRYINTVTGVSSVTAQSVTGTYIYEWNGTNWSETIPEEGYAVWDKTANEYYIFNGTAWTPLGAVQSFLQLSDTPSSYSTAHAVYKVNSATNAVVESAMTVDDSGNVNIPGKLTVAGAIDPTEIILDPQATAPSTTEGAFYYDSVTEDFKFREEDATWRALQFDDDGADVTPKNTRNIRVAEDQSYFIAEAPALDQTQTTGSNTSTSTDAWQSITAGVTGSLVSADIFFASTPATDTRLRIYAGEGTGGTLLSTTPGAAYGTGWQTIVLATPPYITSGTQFTARLDGSSPLNWQFNLNGNPYAGGRWFGGANSDAKFRTTMLQTLASVWKEGMAIVGDLKLIAQNTAARSTTQIYNAAPGQDTQLELNEGATKIIGFSNDPNEVGDLDKKCWTIDAIQSQAGAGGALFLAELSSTQSNVTGDGSGFTPVFDAEITDTGGDYNNSTGVFTAPATDYYMFNLILHLDGIGAGHVTGIISFNASVHPKRFWEYDCLALASGATRIRLCHSWMSKMDVGETATITFSIQTGAKSISLIASGPDKYPQWGGFQIAAGSSGYNPFDQNQYYATAKAGNDSNAGRGEEEPFLTVGKLITEINGQTPSSSNQFMGKLVDGGIYTENVTLPVYSKIYGPAAVIQGNITLNDESSIEVKRLLPESGGSNRSLTKSSGPGSASVRINDTWEVGGGNGISNTSGTVNIETSNVTFSSGNVVGGASTGEININVLGKAVSSTNGEFALHGGAGNLNVRANVIYCPGNNVFDINTGASFNTIIANSIKSGAGKAFDISGGPVVTSIIGVMEETVASTVSGADLNYFTMWYRRAAATYNDYSILQNSLEGILLKTIDPTAEIELSTASVNLNTPTATLDSTGNVKSANGAINFKTKTKVEGDTQPFINLSTTPVVTFTFEKGSKYLCSLEVIGGTIASWEMIFAYNVNVPELVILELNPVMCTLAPQLPLGTFGITVSGYAGPSFSLVVATTGGSIGTSTLVASGITTGTTNFSILNLSNNQ